MSDKELIEKYVPDEKKEEAFNKLKSNYPVQYIIGNVDFYNLNFIVNENVLIPRFETEYLVDDIIKLIKEYKFHNPNILDIGTGSGCIAISLEKNIKSEVEGIDISPKAIETAKINNQRNKSNVNFLTCDLKKYIPDKKIDILVSNPPYVPNNGIYDEKILYEPSIAIFSNDDDDIIFYKNILNIYQKYLNKKNIIAFEIGYNQKERLENFIKPLFKESKIVFKKDLNGYYRYLYIINE